MSTAYPQLLSRPARELARAHAGKPLDELVNHLDLSPSGLFYSPTGNRISSEQLEHFARELRAWLYDHGFPEPVQDTSRLDAQLAVWLRAHLPMPLTEAAQPGVWAFLGTCVAPAVARWRFPGKSGVSSQSRFLGSGRGMRNALGRLWWRAEYMRVSPCGGARTERVELDEQLLHRLYRSEYGLLFELGEDELVGITERPGLCSSRCLNRNVARALIIAHAQHGQGIARSYLMREALKRVGRLASIVVFEALDEAALEQLLEMLMLETIERIRREREIA